MAMQAQRQTLLTLPLDADEATLETAGGKGAALARMAAAGLPVPPGFHVTTAAYKRFVVENGLQPAILKAAREAGAGDPTAQERAAATIRALFEWGAMPRDLASAIRRAYADLEGNGPAVAVRSSATAEDLPEASFAGQQETYLNVRGEAALLEAVRRCWASLWTARAIGYRARRGIASEDVALAVVVQVMVPAGVSGVLFTANPTTGARDELIVNAGFGLGEAIVSGQVTPDSYVLDKAGLAVRQESIGEKAAMVVPVDGQGTASRPVPTARRRERALSPPVLHELAGLGLQIESLFDGTPQDIEWAVADGACWILQARPITGLPPAPLRDVRWEPPWPGSKWIRRQIVENMPEPLSPLFAELYLREGLERSIDVVFGWLFGPSSLFDEMIDRPLFATVNGYAYMGVNIHLTPVVVLRLLRLEASVVPWLFRHGAAYWRDNALPSYLATVQRWKGIDPARASDEELLQGVRSLAYADAEYWFATAMVIGAAKITDALLDWFLADAAPGRGLTSGRYLRGFPSKTLEAEAALLALAGRIRDSDTLRAVVDTTPAASLRDALSGSAEGQALLDAFDGYLDHYGHQIYNLDFAVPTQADDPLPLLLRLKALARGPARDIEAHRRAMARERDQAVERTARSFDPIRRRVFRRLTGWAQRYGPYREEALFYIGAGWPALRRLALQLGGRLAAAGALERPADVFYLEMSELQAAHAARAAGEVRPDLARLAQERRELRDARTRLHPPAAVPPDYRFKVGPFDMSAFETQQRNVGSGPVLHGFAVSPGRATGPASVIRSPAEFEQMQPSSILVCPTTTPAWTPLFGQALGLVTDVGGILAHGSIVAREYGIPAVMGTGNATGRIVGGARITVDGDAGTVTLLDEAQTAAAAPSPPEPALEPGVPSIAGRLATAAVIAGAVIGAFMWLRRRSAPHRRP
jgi:pyruvate,water dikinase